MSLRTMYFERAKAHQELVETLKDAPSIEQRSKADRLLGAIANYTSQIARVSGESLAEPFGEESYRSQGEVAAARAYRTAYFDWLRCGEVGQKAVIGNGAAERSIRLLRETRGKFSALSPEQRDQLAGSQSITYTEGSVGGYFVPAGFVYEIEQATKYFAQLMDSSVFRVLNTATGNILPFPTSNDTEEAWHILGEATQINDNGATQNYPVQGDAPIADAGNVTLGSIPLNAYKGSTGLIRVSLELLQDSAFALEAFLTEKFAERLGRGYEYYFTKGNGANQPTGLLTALAAQGLPIVTAAGSSANDGNAANTGANSIGYQDIVNLIHAVDPSYRNKGAKFMLHDLTLAHLQTRLDGFGRPLWVPAAQEGMVDRLAGFPYVINQSMPQIGASATSIVFGDLQKFVVRKVKDLQILRLDERFADFGEIAFIGFSRVDSNLIFSGGNAIASLVQHS